MIRPRKARKRMQRREDVTPDQKHNACQYYLDGMTEKQAGEHAGISESNMKWVLAEAGIPARKPGTITELSKAVKKKREKEELDQNILRDDGAFAAAMQRAGYGR